MLQGNPRTLPWHIASRAGLVGHIRDRMTLQEKIAQITQLDIGEVLDYSAAYHGEFRLNDTKLEFYAQAGIGSFLNSPTAGGPIGKLQNPTCAQWRAALRQLEDAYSAAGKIPPVFGIDSMHGANYVADGVMYPHALHLAASFSAYHAYLACRSAARHTRAAGIPWVFAPVLDVPMSSRFPRVYETFGEDPAVVAAFGVASVQGLQGHTYDVTFSPTPSAKRVSKGGAAAQEDAAAAAAGSREAAGSPDPSGQQGGRQQERQGRTQPSDGLGRSAEDLPLAHAGVVAACAKHFVAYQASRSGYDRSPAWIPEGLMRARFLPPFQAAIDAGVATFMLAYNCAGDLPAILSKRWTQKWLREHAGFSGMVVTDWQEVYNQVDWHHAAANELEAVVQAFRHSSVDMAMVPYKDRFLVDAVDAVNRGYLSEARIDEAVDAVLGLKLSLGLIKQPAGADSASSAADAAGDGLVVGDGTLGGAVLEDVPGAVVDAERQESLDAAADGFVLLKNKKSCLPLKDLGGGDTVAVIGPNAESAANLLGGWSIHWQGPQANTDVPFDSIADAFARCAGERGTKVVRATGVDKSGEFTFDDVVGVAGAADRAIIFAYGEGCYTEVFGSLAASYLPKNQLALAKSIHAIAERANIPFIGVYIGGRDRLLRAVDSLFDAHIVGFYPGPYGGQALAEILLGRRAPSGRLPITLHFGDTQALPYWRAFSDYTLAPPSLEQMEPRHYQRPLYPFGHGLTYSPMAFSALHATVHRPDGSVTPAQPVLPAPGAMPVPHASIGPHETVTVTVQVHNSGSQAASWPLLMYVADDACISPPPPPMVKAFARVTLAEGKSTTVSFEVTPEMLAFDAPEELVDVPGRYVQPGTFTVWVEGLQCKLHFQGDPLLHKDWWLLREH